MSVFLSDAPIIIFSYFCFYKILALRANFYRLTHNNKTDYKNNGARRNSRLTVYTVTMVNFIT